MQYFAEEGLRLQALNRAQRVRKQGGGPGVTGDGQPGDPQTPPIGDEPNGLNSQQVWLFSRC